MVIPIVYSTKSIVVDVWCQAVFSARLETTNETNSTNRDELNTFVLFALFVVPLIRGSPFPTPLTTPLTTPSHHPLFRVYSRHFAGK